MNYKKLDDYSFGKMPMDVNMSKILNEIGDNKLKKKVASFITRLGEDVSEIANIKNHRTKRHMSHLLCISLTNIVEGSETFNFHPLVKSHMIGIVRTRTLKTFNGKSDHTAKIKAKQREFSKNMNNKKPD